MAKLNKRDLQKVDTKTGTLKYWWPFIEMIEKGESFKLGTQGLDGEVIIASGNSHTTANTKRLVEGMKNCITSQMVTRWLSRKNFTLPKQGGGTVKVTDLWKDNVKPMKTDNSTKVGGRDTEVFSEILAQYCLAYAIINDQAATPENSLNIEGGTSVTFKPEAFNACKKLIITPSAFNLNNQSFRNKLAQFASQPLGTSGVDLQRSWMQATGVAMLELKRKFDIPRNVRIYNDKIFGGSSFSANPYAVYMAAKKSTTGGLPGEDKWNPADMWVMTEKGVRAQVHMNRTIKSTGKVGIEVANNFLLQQFNGRDIIPVSLKKPRVKPEAKVINSDQYFDRIVLGRGPNPTVEYTFTDSKGNADCKINFTVQTVKTKPGPGKNSLRNMLAQRMRGGSAGGKVESEKQIRIKYHVNNKKIELEYSQSNVSQEDPARAKMGSLGNKNFTSIINQTTKQGVNELNKIQKNYSDIGVKQSPWFNASLKEDLTDAQYDRCVEYVSEIWKYITGDNAPDLTKYQATQSTSGIASKALAGEFGISIAGIKNEKVKTRLVTLLYEACASISFGSGLNKDELELLKASGGAGVARKSKFNSSVHVKVF
ncbi:hypothetical protein RW110999_186 [Cyanophage S-RIM4]|nr:hypothetical protein RW110999_186 [Cyanophage S-RIM4]